MFFAPLFLFACVIADFVGFYLVALWTVCFVAVGSACVAAIFVVLLLLLVVLLVLGVVMSLCCVFLCFCSCFACLIVDSAVHFVVAFWAT